MRMLVLSTLIRRVLTMEAVTEFRVGGYRETVEFLRKGNQYISVSDSYYHSNKYRANVTHHLNRVSVILAVEVKSFLLKLSLSL